MSPVSLTQVAIAVVENQGRFLVGRRAEHLPLGGLWEFPGGKVESQETAAAAAPTMSAPVSVSQPESAALRCQV